MKIKEVIVNLQHFRYTAVASIEGYNKDKKLISDENIIKYKNELTDHIKEDENRNARRT